MTSIWRLPSNAPPSEGTAIMITWDGETDTEEDFRHLERTFKSANLGIRHLRLKGKGADAVLAQFKRITAMVDGKGNLVVLCYSGHAHVQAERLLASGQAGGNFDFTDLQMHARDALKANVLMIVDCCFAGLDIPPPDYSNCTPNRNHVVELLAAGGSRMAVTAGFSQRVSNALNIAGADLSACRTIKELFDVLISSVRGHPTAPGYYRLECGAQSMLWKHMD
ncbi:hypothetical protein LTR36_009367 [Oleoguttula mirabilis]|uniref:Caspase domain-containing protein n=1 Tax=Oleoguttula mirabilis TaxID=1507867 RepID=A0AAV9JS55_9PEZI|nr:hypothetical protein LTR36_009367 [Oleoguttula mirabilis]